MSKDNKVLSPAPHFSVQISGGAWICGQGRGMTWFPNTALDKTSFCRSDSRPPLPSPPLPQPSHKPPPPEKAGIKVNKTVSGEVGRYPRDPHEY